MKIVSVDLGQRRSVACVYLNDSVSCYQTVPTTPQALHDLLAEHTPDRVVIEIGPTAGWVYDLACSMDLTVQVLPTTSRSPARW